MFIYTVEKKSKKYHSNFLLKRLIDKMCYRNIINWLPLPRPARVEFVC